MGAFARYRNPLHLNFDSSFPREDLDGRPPRRPWGLWLLGLLLAGIAGMLVETSHPGHVSCDARGRHVVAGTAAAREPGAGACTASRPARGTLPR